MPSRNFPLMICDDMLRIEALHPSEIFVQNRKRLFLSYLHTFLRCLFCQIVISLDRKYLICIGDRFIYIGMRSIAAAFRDRFQCITKEAPRMCLAPHTDGRILLPLCDGIVSRVSVRLQISVEVTKKILRILFASVILILIQDDRKRQTIILLE